MPVQLGEHLVVLLQGCLRDVAFLHVADHVDLTAQRLEGGEVIFCKLHQRCRRRSEKNHTFHEVKSFRFLLRIFLL